MEIKANLTRMDRVLANIHMEWRLRTNILSFLFLWISFVILFILLGNRPGSSEKWLSFIITCGFIAIAYKIFVITCLMLWVFISSTEKSRVLGEHKYEILKDGLRDKTNVKNTLIKWESIKSILKDDLFIIVRIKRYLFLTIPKRDFPSFEQFDQFHQNLLNQWHKKKNIYNKTTGADGV